MNNNQKSTKQEKIQVLHKRKQVLDAKANYMFVNKDK